MNNLSWLLYFGDVVSSIRSLLVALTALWGSASLLGSFIFALSYAEGDYEQKKSYSATYKKYVLKSLLPVALVSALLMCVLPSKQTIYMIAASETGETVLRSPTGQKALDAVNRYLDSVAKTEKEDKNT